MRRLALRREPLAELGTHELAAVAGGQQALPTRDCFTGYYPSINAPCTELTGTILDTDQTLLCTDV
ncbi:MAG TPA: hypothetical protein VF519_04995 [Mycobacteriales bacterium]